MEYAFIVWAIGTLPTIATVICHIAFLPMFIALAGICIIKISQAVDNQTEEDIVRGNKLISFCKWIFFPCFIAWFIFLLAPDKETAYAMAAAYGVQSVAENERVQKIAGQGIDVLESYLEKTKKELDEKK